MTDISLSLVIPCYNEAASLPALVERCRTLLSRPDIEVILVDNGSTDDSPRLLPGLIGETPRLRLVRVEVNRGYGFGILRGLHAASGAILAWTHADLQTDPADVLRGLALYDAAPHPERLFVKGRRSGRPLGDVAFTLGMSLFEALLLGRWMIDINAQPTMFPKTFFDRWAHAPDDFSLDLYAFYSARVAGLTVARIPVVFGKRAHGVSHWNVDWRAKWKFIRRTAEFSFRLRRRLHQP